MTQNHSSHNPPSGRDDAAEGQNETPTDLMQFDPVPVRARHDGWTPERQLDFIEALAETGCVDQAARIAGMSVQSAYRMRRRADAQAFRLAWEAALDHAISRLSHAAISRAIHGTPRPVFYQGEQVGEWRHFDERLTMFMLRLRDPVRYGQWRDRLEAQQHEDGPALILNRWQNRLEEWAHTGSYDRSGPDMPAEEEEEDYFEGESGDEAGGTGEEI